MYIITFALTILFTYLAERNFKKQNKRNGVFFSVIAILLPSLLAALRSENIGTDVGVYVKPYFEKALGYASFSDFVESIDSDYLFLLIVYFIANLTENLQFVFFAIEFIIMLFIYLGIYNFRKRASMSLMMFFFLTLFYNKTYNLSRQSIAIAIVFFGMKYVLDRNLWRYLLCLIVASNFHYSAMFMIILYFLYDISYIKGNFIIKLLIVTAIVAIFANFQTIFQYFIQSGILPAKYMRYVEAQKGSFGFIETAYRLINIILIGLTLKSFNKLDKNNKFLYFVMILDIIIYQLGILSDFTQRISLYFGINTIYIMPQFIKSVKQERTNIKISAIILILIQIAYWGLNYAYLNIGETFPYEFFFNYQ